MKEITELKQLKIWDWIAIIFTDSNTKEIVVEDYHIRRKEYNLKLGNILILDKWIEEGEWLYNIIFQLKNGKFGYCIGLLEREKNYNEIMSPEKHDVIFPKIKFLESEEDLNSLRGLEEL